MTDTKHPSVAPEENWEFYLYPTEDGPVFATFHTEIDGIDKEAYCFCSRVMIPIKEADETGAPSEAEDTRLYEMEDQLVAALDQAEAPCLLLARVTHDGLRELVFQLKDRSTFQPVVTLWMDECKRDDLRVTDHKGWDFFDEFVWPSDEDWIWIYDRRVVDSLIEGGSKPESEHKLEFSFSGTEESLKKASGVLTGRGYTDAVFGDDADSLIIVNNMPLNVNAIWEESIAHLELATELKIDYNGWSAEVAS